MSGSVQRSSLAILQAVVHKLTSHSAPVYGDLGRSKVELKQTDKDIELFPKGYFKYLERNFPTTLEESPSTPPDWLTDITSNETTTTSSTEEPPVLVDGNPPGVMGSLCERLPVDRTYRAGCYDGYIQYKAPQKTTQTISYAFSGMNVEVTELRECLESPAQREILLQSAKNLVSTTGSSTFNEISIPLPGSRDEDCFVISIQGDGNTTAAKETVDDFAGPCIKLVGQDKVSASPNAWRIAGFVTGCLALVTGVGCCIRKFYPAKPQNQPIVAPEEPSIQPGLPSEHVVNSAGYASLPDTENV